MPVHNADVARLFEQMADLLELSDANPFRVRAYRTAARTIGDLSRDVAELLADGEDLSKLQGIGDDLAGKIREILDTGSFAQLDELEGSAVGGLDKLLRVRGLGPKKVQALHRGLGVTTLPELKDAAAQGEVRKLPGFGRKTEDNLLREIEHAEERARRIRIDVVEPVAEALVVHLEKLNGTKRVTVAGSFRRRRSTVGDLDLLVTCTQGSRQEVMQRFVTYDEVTEIISHGETRSSVILRSGLQVDLRAVPAVAYGAALHYFTGSKAHNIAVRKLGRKQGLKINEYGVFRDGDRIAGRTEEEVYDQVDLPYIEPELREARGELDAAREGNLPDLLRPEDLRGDLHAHTDQTDGRASLEEMVQAARDRGYEYLAITNHSQRVTMAKGYDADALAREIERIDELNDGFDDFVVLKAIEVDILEDGSLDLPDQILERLDLTVCSVHYNRNLSRDKQTERIIRAMDNPHFRILGHPSGRLIGEREAYEVDLEKVIQAAAERGRFLELNAHPERLDLDDVHCKLAKELGVKIAVSTDAHSTAGLGYMRYGVWQARRGWIEKEDVLNTRSWKELRKILEDRKA